MTNPAHSERQFFIDLQRTPRTLWDPWCYRWELREGEMGNAHTVHEDEVKTWGWAVWRWSARRAARRAKRRVLALEDRYLPREALR